MRERLTPYKLSLAALLTFYVPTDDSVTLECLEDASCVSLPNEVYRDFAVLFLKFMRSASAPRSSLEEQEPALVDLVSELEGMRTGHGNAIGRFLRFRLSRIQSPDDVMDLLSALDSLMDTPGAGQQSIDEFTGRPTYVGRNSCFGVFLRRVVLASEQMLFDGVCRLYDDVRNFCEDFSRSTKAAANRQFSAGGSAIAQLIHKAHLSPRVLQQILRAEALRVERGISTMGFEETEEDIKGLLEVVPNLPQAFFLRYLNCLVHKEYQGAVENLHRYFDYAIRTLEARANGEKDSAEVVRVRGKRRKSVFQLASLNMAALQFHFGRLDEALLAVNETMRVAQQHGDHHCVAWALSWLYRIKAAKKDSEAPQLLQRCLEHATALKMEDLQQLMMFSEAERQVFFPIPSISEERYDLASRNSRRGHGPRARDHRSESALTRNLFVQESKQSSSAPGPGEQPKEAKPEESIVKDSRANFHNVVGRIHLLRSSLWELAGDETLAQLALDSKLACHSDERSSGYDALVALCRLAHKQVSSANFTDGSARGPESKPPTRLHAVGLQTLIDARLRFPRVPGKLWAHATASLLFDATKNRNQIARAGALCRQLLGLNVLSDGNDTLYVGSRIRHAQYLLLLGRVEDSYSTYLKLLDYCSSKGMVTQEAVVLLEMSRLTLKSSKTTGNAPYALPFLMRTLSLTRKYRLANLEAEASVLLASVHLQMGNARRAQGVLLDSMTQIMGSAMASVQGSAHLCYAKCLFGVASMGLQKAAGAVSLRNSAPEESSFQSLADEALQSLLRAIEAFEASQDYTGPRESLYLLARLYNELPGREHDRDVTAQRFMEIDVLIGEARGKHATDLNCLHSRDGLQRMEVELRG